MKYLILSLAVLAAGASFGAGIGYGLGDAQAETEAAAKAAPYTKIDAATLQNLIATEKNLVIVDSRGAKYMGDGTIIKGAKVLPADATNPQSLATLVPAKDTPVVFYCSDINCPASESAAHKASELGYNRVYKYPGGIADWKEKKLPTDKI